MNTCTHPTRRNGYCPTCLCRVPTVTDAFLTGVWRAAVKRLQAQRQGTSPKRILCTGSVQCGKVQIKQ